MARAVFAVLLPLFLLSCASHSTSKDAPSGEAAKKKPSYERQDLDPELTMLPRADGAPLSSEERRILADRTGLEFNLTSRDNEDVQNYFTFFTHKARGTFTNWLSRSETYLPMVRQVLTSQNLPQDLAMLPYVESGYNPFAVSRAGAVGMWQFMRETGRKYGLAVDWWVDERRDPVLSTQAAARYLSDLYAMFGDWYLALAAYNAGEGKIGCAVEKTNSSDFFNLCENNDKLKGREKLKPETRNYVPKFIAVTKIFQNLKLLGFTPVSWDRAPMLSDVRVFGGTDLMALAQAADMSWNEFSAYNPAFLRRVSPPGRDTIVHVPAEKAQAVLAYVADPKSRPYSGYITYNVRKNDTPAKVSRKFGVPVSAILSLNDINGGVFSKGQTLLIPKGGSARELAKYERGAKAAKPDAGPRQDRASKAGAYTVRKGDTLYAVSRTFGVSVAALQAANGLEASPSLKVGQKLVIPGSASPEVKEPSRALAAAKPAPQTAAAAKPQAKPQAKAQPKAAEPTAQQQAPPAARPTKIASADSQAGGTYTVQSGDTLYSIARRRGLSPDEVRRCNGLSGNGIHPGQVLRFSGCKGG